MQKSIYILGISESHVATAAILKNGEIIACASEERFTRIKGQWGYPPLAIDYCLQQAGISSSQLDGVFIGFKNPTLFLHGKGENKKTSSAFKNITQIIKKILLFLISISPFFYTVYEFIYKYLFTPLFLAPLDKHHKSFIADKLAISSNIIYTIDHHIAHAYAAYYADPNLDMHKNEKALVITNDGIGDDACSKVFIVKRNTWELIASTPNHHTLGWLYLFITEYLGMKPNEHEYKVMGLAPYASKESSQGVYNILKNLMWVEGLTIKSSIPMLGYPAFLEKNLKRIRFDAIAGGIQKFTEEILVTQVSNAIKKTKIQHLLLGGGVFMNVKANMEIANIPSLKSIYVMPSASDESTAIGAAYFGYKQYSEENKSSFTPKPLKNLYLGPSFSSEEVRKTIEMITKTWKKKVKITLMKEPSKQISKLLENGEIVARCVGRMEFGARALGNRSILANPSDPHVIRIINEQIKGRDFWMPFAPVILKEKVKKYILNPKNIDSPFMMFAFQTTDQGKKDLIAGLHPYDYTARPQILTREQNPEYYNIIKEFEKLTGIGGLLNTSFNIHGEPVVCSPEDALRTLEKSGLRYLQLENYLIEKL